MQRQLLFTLSFATACLLQAQLYHATPASLQEHLREVNVQWQIQGHVPTGGDGVVQFGNDAERIATHLQLVRTLLTERTPEGLAAEQAQRRSDLLERLEVYADGGTFPQNYVLPYRNPIFIDPHGTACAVGHLMIESGHAALAQRISAEMNNAYLLDMEWPEISTWANDHGFTADELAWVQPGYLPTHPWAPLGEGTNGPVNVLLPLDNGDLLVAGEFTTAGGASITNVAIWNGAVYTTLGGGLEGDITCAVQHGTDIYIGGSLLGGGIADLARWDGNQWTYFTIFEGKLPWINTLHVHDNELYAAGEVMGFAGIDHMVRRVNTDGTYMDVGSPLDERVLVMTTYFGFLVIGGEFDGLDNGTDPLIAHLALLEGDEWSQLADGTDAPVRALLVDGDHLYVAGDLFVDADTTFGLARLTSLGPTLELLHPHDGAIFDPELAPNYIGSLQMHANGLYFGGRFFAGTFDTMGNNLGLFDNDTGTIEPMIWVEGEVHALALHQDRLVAGGAFAVPYQHIAVLDLSTSVDERARANAILYPNPSTDHVMITMDNMELARSIEVLDHLGRIVNVPVTRQSDAIRLDIGRLSPGSYVVRSTTTEDVVIGRFIRE